MIDKEKVIKSLDEHLHCSGRGKSGYCHYSDDELWNDISDALALLKEQEPVKPEAYLVANEYTFYRCPACKIGWHYKYDYCPKCGRAVKWDA